MKLMANAAKGLILAAFMACLNSQCRKCGRHKCPLVILGMAKCTTHN